MQANPQMAGLISRFILVLIAVQVFFSCCTFANAQAPDNTTPRPLPVAEPESVPIQVQIDGVLVAKGKYSLTIRGLNKDYDVLIPNGTPILLRLTRPRFDLSANQVVLTLPNSANEGDAKNNKTLTYDLPSPLFLYSRFADAPRRDRVINADNITLTTFSLIDQLNPSILDDELVVAGELLPGKEKDKFLLRGNDQSMSVKLGKRNGLLSGFTILDLKPNVTDLFVTGELDGDQVLASRIEFAHVGDPLQGEDPDLARCLFLGDSVSFNYQRPLRQALAGKINLHHPPTTCGGSSNWRKIHRWVGNYQAQGRGWDVITFNFGLHDQVTTKAAYQTNLRRAIGQLKRTGAKLIWVTTTPIPDGSAAGNNDPPIGHVTGRMKLQNQWAREVMDEFPEITICDLWQVVDNGRDQAFADWWQGSDYGFEYTQSVPLARELGQCILNVLGSGELNPMSAHNLRVAPANK